MSVAADATNEVVYEVNLEVDAAIAAEYRAWLHAHVAAMLALPGFVDAQLFDVTEPVGTGRADYCVHYRLRDAAALEAYLRDHAARMRAEGEQRFGGRFRASRRVLRSAA